jgi:hypothetical protein
VEFLRWFSYLEGIFRDFSCWLYLTARENKSLVGDSAHAPTRVICSADTKNASTVCNCGGDRADFHAATDEVVINAKDELAWRGANVSGVGNCVQFARGGCTAVSLPVDLPRQLLGDFFWQFLMGLLIGGRLGSHRVHAL